jgi:HSP20 family protein
MFSFPELNELSDDVQRIFRELDERCGSPCRPVNSVYAPALDVVELADAVVVYVDLPGVVAASLRVLFKDSNLLIAGEKGPNEPCARDGSAFHLVERGFGRFARIVRLQTAVDTSRASAVLAAGELRVSVPRIAERRGREVPVTIEERPRQP